AVVEPVSAVSGAALVLMMLQVIPYALAFAAGAMIFVVVEELIPESQTNGNTDIATMGLMVGFVLMRVMDVGLGSWACFDRRGVDWWKTNSKRHIIGEKERR